MLHTDRNTQAILEYLCTESASMGRKANQKFVQIPTAKLKERTSQLCEQKNIDFIETEEANINAASFLDGDSFPKYGKNLKPGNRQ